MLRLWNTASRSLEEFKPIRPGEVGMYTCGPTVYNPLTLGNWRKYTCDDVLHRTLSFLGYEVHHVTNITDVGHLVDDRDDGEDKMEREAVKTGKTAWDIALENEALFVEGMHKLNILMPERLPRATDHIPEQIALVQELEAKGFTYRISDGIYFDTAKFKAYGALSGQSLEEKKSGARVEENAEKRNPTDFALWKFSPSDAKRQMEWESPWGVGFPGWHIECSAMAVKYLGQPFDIHGGGVDHIAVHHENEIAQTEAATGHRLANYWVHNEFLTVDGGRMGKSLGNGYTLEDVEKRGFDLVTLRFFYLGAHYRSKLNFTWEALEGAKHSLQNLKKAFLSWGDETGSKNAEKISEFREALEDDLNTPKAMALVWEVTKSGLPSAEKRATLLKMDDVLGLGMSGWKNEDVKIPDDIASLAEERWRARRAKNWAESDRLRDALKEKGWLMEDGKDSYVVVKA